MIIATEQIKQIKYLCIKPSRHYKTWQNLQNCIESDII